MISVNLSCFLLTNIVLFIENVLVLLHHFLLMNDGLSKTPKIHKPDKETIHVFCTLDIPMLKNRF